MAAGKGTRLMPLTKYIPKCLIEVKGKPLLQWIEEAVAKACKSLNIEDFRLIAITSYEEDKVKEFCEKSPYQWYTKTQFGGYGTANAIRSAKDFIRDSSFIVLAGDVIYKYEDIVNLIVKHNSILCVWKDEDLYRYGTMDIKEGNVIGINEKSTKPTSHFVNCSGYHFSINIFDYIDQTPVDGRFNERIITNTVTDMVDQGNIFKMVLTDTFNEITFPEDISKLEAKL
jgi:bifunctional UDP-N-acetylglucosamine pyrophosphorylase/glucosamine-1-phosphate N-acetyltransferase